MAKQFIKATYTGNSFITHEEQEVNKLSFRVWNDLTILDCADTDSVRAIQSMKDWVKKVNGTVLTKLEAIAYAKPIWEAAKTEEINRLQSEKDALTVSVFDVDKII